MKPDNKRSVETPLGNEPKVDDDDDDE